MESDRYKLLREVEDFYYKQNGKLHGAEKVVMFGGDNQVLLNCYGTWVVVKESEIYLAKELSEEELEEYYEEQFK